MNEYAEEKTQIIEEEECSVKESPQKLPSLPGEIQDLFGSPSVLEPSHVEQDIGSYFCWKFINLNLSIDMSSDSENSHPNIEKKSNLTSNGKQNIHVIWLNYKCRIQKGKMKYL